MGNKKLFLGILAVILCVALLFFLWANRPAGTVSGPENDFITIGETVYIKDPADHYQDFSIADKGRRLGSIESRYVKLRVFAVKNDPNRDYLYVSSGYEGDFYVKESLVKE